MRKDQVGEKEITAPDNAGALDKKSKKAVKSDSLENRDFSELVKQIQTEYEIDYRYLKPKLEELGMRRKLYSNQRRDKKAVGDPLLFTVLQTVVASLYADRMSSNFEAREEGDIDVPGTLLPLAEFDYEEMGKAEFDYDWDFNTAFFGRGLLLNIEYDAKKKCPMPEVIDNMTWLRDPDAKSVNGDRRGRGAMQHGGREVVMTTRQMKRAGVYFNFQNLKAETTDVHSLTGASAQAREDAQGLSPSNQKNVLVGDNAKHTLLEWFTHYNGKKVFVTLSSDRKTVVRYRELKHDWWPIVDRPMYPIAHDWDGVSIPDLIEDKQRARAKVQNLALAGVEAGQHPTYLYDSNKIKNRGNLEIAFNKHIPVDGSPSGAIQLVDRAQVKSEVDWILGTLDLAAQKATATPDIQQGASTGGQQTATETNIIAAKVDTRYSLTAKIWGWSEREFWRQWYMHYKDYFNADIDTKTIRIAGAMGPKWRKLTRENIIGLVDPDIFIESKSISEEMNTSHLQKYRLLLKDIMATDPQSSNLRFALRKVGQLSGFKKDEIEQILPPTVDEINAEEENEKLNENKKVLVQVYDDDFVHQQMHNKAADTPAKYAHLRAHAKAMMLKRAKPEMDMARNRPIEPVEEANVGAPLSKTPTLGSIAPLPQPLAG